LSLRLKMFLSTLLLPLSLWAALKHGMVWNYLVCAALGCGWLGDALLSRFPPVCGKMKETFLPGMASFALGHILYIIAFVHSLVLLPALRMPVPGEVQGLEILPGILPVFLLAGTLAWVFWVFRPRPDRVLCAAALIYALILSAMAAFALCAGFTGSGFVPFLPLGGVLFMISDGVIAAHEFSGKIEDDGVYQRLVWWTYVPAQLCLLLGSACLY